MFKLKQVVAFTALMATAATSYAAVEADKRPINELYQNALREGGIVTVYAGGDTPGQQDGIKQAFEKRFRA